MSVRLDSMQVEKFRAMGRAARDMADKYKNGDGPDPTSGATFRDGVPQCTWGQLLDQSGFKPVANRSTGDNLGCFAEYIGNNAVIEAGKVVGVESGFMADKEVSYDISKIKMFGNKIMHANDPAPDAEARKAATWKLLEELADEIDNVFGAPKENEFQFFQQAADNYLEDLVLGEVKLTVDEF